MNGQIFHEVLLILRENSVLFCFEEGPKLGEFRFLPYVKLVHGRMRSRALLIALALFGLYTSPELTFWENTPLRIPTRTK